MIPAEPLKQVNVRDFCNNNKNDHATKKKKSKPIHTGSSNSLKANFLKGSYNFSKSSK